MPSIAQIQRRNKRENLEVLKRRSFEATVARLVEAGQVDPAAPMAERVHKVLLVNRPFAATLPEPVNPPAAPLFDLLIATRKVAKFSGTVQSNDGRIVRIKKAGQDWQEPKSTWRLSDPAIIERLADYTLVDQVATGTEIWHRYTLKNRGAL